MVNNIYHSYIYFLLCNIKTIRIRIIQIQAVYPLDNANLNLPGTFLAFPNFIIQQNIQ